MIVSLIRTYRLFFETQGRKYGRNHRVIISLEREHAFTIEWEETDANFPYQNVQCHSVTSLETDRSLADGPIVAGKGGG